MKFLADHCLYGKTVSLLRSNGQEVVTLKDLNKIEAEDEEVIRIAQEENAVLVTHDLDFSNILNYPPKNYKGIIILRLTPRNENKIHNLLLEFIKSQPLGALAGCLVVIDGHHIRIKK